MRGIPQASGEIAGDLNVLTRFLARTDVPTLTRRALAAVTGNSTVDCLVLLGNGVLHTAERAVQAMSEERLAPLLLISGGRGHSTRFLEEAVAAHRLYNGVVVPGQSEAEMLADIAIRYWGLSPGCILLETTSRNCGENATHSRSILARAGLYPRSMILVQDPTMQRRTHASFEWAWHDSSHDTAFLSCPGLQPTAHATGNGLSLQPSEAAGLWPIERFVSLVLGEIPRLRDDPSGYGPSGRGFIGHVDIPPGVEEAFARLAQTFPNLLTVRDLGSEA